MSTDIRRAGSITAIGSPLSGGTPNEVLYIDASGNLADTAQIQTFSSGGAFFSFIDSSPRGNTLTGYQAPQTQSGKFGSALLGQAVTYQSYSKTPPNFSITNDWTVTAWVKRGYCTILEAATNPFIGYDISIAENGNGKIVLFQGVYTSTNAVPSDTNWHFIVVTYSGTSLKVYIDTVLSNTYTITIPPYSFATDTLRIGNPDHRYNLASMDEIAVFNYAFTTGNISTYWNGGTGQAYTGLESGLQALYHFDELLPKTKLTGTFDFTGMALTPYLIYGVLYTDENGQIIQSSLLYDGTNLINSTGTVCLPSLANSTSLAIDSNGYIITGTGGGSQTPWTSNIDTAGYYLTESTSALRTVAAYINFNPSWGSINMQSGVSGYGDTGGEVYINSSGGGVTNGSINLTSALNLNFTTGVQNPDGAGVGGDCIINLSGGSGSAGNFVVNTIDSPSGGNINLNSAKQVNITANNNQDINLNTSGAGYVKVNGNIIAGSGSISDPLYLTGYYFSQDSTSGLVWEPYVGGPTLQAPTGQTVYIQGAGETGLGSILLGSPNIQLNSFGAGSVNLGTSSYDDLYLTSGAGSVHVGPTGGGYGTYITGNGGVSISSGGGLQLSAYQITLSGAVTFPDYTTVGTYSEGEIAYNFSTHRPCFFDGSNWNDL